jgi:hypothetical protein
MLKIAEISDSIITRKK